MRFSPLSPIRDAVTRKETTRRLIKYNCPPHKVLLALFDALRYFILLNFYLLNFKAPEDGTILARVSESELMCCTHSQTSRDTYRINLDKKQILPAGLGGKLRELLFQYYPACLMDYLAVPVASSCPESKTVFTTTTVGLGRLRLPTELILIVFDKIDDPQDAVFLGLAHDALLPIGWNRIKALIMAASPIGSWAGDRIVCIGDYAESDDLPMLTLSERQELSTKKHNNLYQYASNEFTVAGDPVKWAPDAKLVARLSSHEQMMLRRIVDYPQDSQWVLCNLTKGQYITGEAIEDLFGEPPSLGPEHFTTFGFGHVLLAHICWSSDPTTGINCYRALSYGDWAGDEFEITTMQEMKSCEGEEPWEDVSDSFLEEINDLWEQEYGMDWREQI
ncbi:hypothetical protein A0H81_11852 [Grifola frondosa]|uniref:Uncharacterized protein n=1 Tax=Grifola frondosa TaxID=5627 RepID=A0A1C7LVP3_GRIFR|nr:hypothetical protein A0H81_11852 [Grifola frondosa]